MFNDFRADGESPAYIQLKEYIETLITQGLMPLHHKLPSTRELAGLLGVSRSTVISAYEALERTGWIEAVKGRGNFVARAAAHLEDPPGTIDWGGRMGDRALLAEEMDLMKHGVRWEKGMIAFTSIAPDERLFDMNGVKRAFLDRMALEGDVLLNYGYAQGYRPLMRHLMKYMQSKGVDTTGKDILITNGFTEGFDLLLSGIRRGSGRILCENPTHQTAIKMMKLHGFEPAGVKMERDGMSMRELKTSLDGGSFDLAYLIPSYHNPTGIVTSPEKRMEMLRLLGEYEVPVVEDGFNEELRYSGAHAAPLIACAGAGNSVAYIGSFSKILFPGIRVGWVVADRELIGYLESLKRARSIHTSTLDQALLFQYLHNGNFERYLKRARTEYKRKYELAVQGCREHIPMKSMSGEGGLHVFVELQNGLSAREVLERCRELGVVFMPGDVFYTDGGGQSTLRIGFSRVSEEKIGEGLRIIGGVVKELGKQKKAAERDKRKVPEAGGDHIDGA
ncbi:PLP-dependent aminotransferase family protein [Saccharibacillus sp. CPCC 101409]|uniref:aminotransferase-like domain-containing protein n=1 Tax=Saccharibacillus sp. CPCC 101409 TaxID=3058041 RepID=UPI002671C239|nr:PLP-dependent aminotransferase family protein [Saccharibacillus sp. CPCC 101409]MDO3411746.1 PLP-dependent aminotransferase family protein [Saccharibacillus sp. CPCC 101409]